jgi:hypothetical protein
MITAKRMKGMMVGLLILGFWANVYAVEVDRLELKKALKAAGYYHENPAAKHPKEVAAAIKHYEQDHGMPATGDVSPALLQSLGLSPKEAPAPTPKPEAQASVAPAAPAPMPSKQLSAFIDAHLDAILSPLENQTALPRQQAVDMRERFADQMTKAPAPQQPVYRQACSVVDALLSAMDERENAIVNSRHSSMPGVQDIHDARVSVSARHGRAALKSESRENQRDANRANQKTKFFEEAAAKQWTDRTVLLRQTITRAYSVEREMERQSQLPR